MKKEILLFQKDELTYKFKFYTLMNLLISNQSESKMESFLLMGIFYIQIISSFFPDEIGVFNSVKSKSDKLLNYIEKIIRVKNLFRNNYKYFRILKFSIFIVFLLIIIHFIFSCKNITRTSFYSTNNKFINCYIKVFIYVAYNIIYDISLCTFCFGSDIYNPLFDSIECRINKFITQTILSILFMIISLVLYIFISIYYNDTFYLSNSYYAKMSCNYDFYLGVNSLVISCLSTQVKYLTKEIFLIYNLFISIILFFYYLKHYLYYNKYINIFAGMFHMLYAWTSIFSLFFSFFDVKEKGIIYIITSIIVCFFYLNIKNRMESKIFLEMPYYKIENKFYVLFYLRNIIEKINNIEESYEDKSLLSAIIQMHFIECPNVACLLKTNEDIYLPLTNKWSDKSKKKVEDEVFLKNFIVIIMNYFLSTHDCSVDMYLNLSLYQLKVIGNYCQAIYYYKKLTELKLSLKERYSLIRLNIQISKGLIEKLKPSTEQCPELENLNISQYYKYDSLSQNFIEEINNDVNLSLEFWNSFLEPLKEANKKVDFNKIFKLTDKIRITKKNIEEMWIKLLKIYDGVNDFFQIYMDYVEQINDDDLKRRDLEVLKRKNDNIGEHININFYSILFNKETGIIIANGDKGSEGIIQLTNNEIENIFKYKSMDLKGMNISCLMPKIFSKDHSKYMERYFKIGEKKFIDKSTFKSFGKDKNNFIIKIRLSIKIFPILNENVFFASLISKENIDDIILIDDQFIIQGMSSKLMHILNINNKYLFQENEIPFYVICRKFINFYNIFLKGKQKKNINTEKEKKFILEEGIKEEEKREKKENQDEKEDIHDNIEINENVELEYEIKLPQFLIDYSEKTNKNETKFIVQLMANNIEEDENEKNDDEDENESLLKSEYSNRKKTSNQNNNQENSNIQSSYNTPAPTPTPTPTPDGETPNINASLITNSIISKEGDKNIDFKKYSHEEKLYKTRMNQYKTLFYEGKIDELDELIENCNKNSTSIEYKFNFTFDRYKFGKNQIAYIVRCVDTKNDIGNSDEESEIDPNPKMAKYKKEKTESIKPLFELLEDERKDILKLPEEFLKLSLENKKFQKLLQICKNDITSMSKAYGQKKDQVLEDENSSQSSQAGYDSGLLKKNRIEEIRSNLMKNISGFYTLKYIKSIFLLISIISFIFAFLYIYSFTHLNNHLKNSFIINITLYETVYWTSGIINLFISLRILYQKYIIDKSDDFKFFDFLIDTTENKNELKKSNMLYYNELISYTKGLYKNAYDSIGKLEMDIPIYLNENQLKTIFWDSIEVTFMNESYKKYTKNRLKEYFPMSYAQFLTNALNFIEDNTFNSINDTARENFNKNPVKNKLYFDYITVLIIENGYDNILPNLINKLSIIPNIISKYNSSNKSSIILFIFLFIFLMIILNIGFFFFFISTNKSMTDGLKKMTKIRLEKIEEIIKRIKIFSINLKKYREKELKISDENKNNSDLSDNDNYHNYDRNGIRQNEKENKKLEQEASLVNNSGFNTDFKKYTPLTILNNLILPPIIFYIIIFLTLFPIYYLTLEMIGNTNLLLLVQNYIYGKLISTNSRIIDIKCYMSECNNNETALNYSGLVDMSLIQQVVKGINILPAIGEYYSEKFLLNACAAALNQEKDPVSYNKCLSDPYIITANNTDNLIKLIENYVDYIKKEFEIKNSTGNYNRKQLFNSRHFRNIEYIFCNYIFNIEEIFSDLINEELLKYLDKTKFFISFIVIYIGLTNIIYCLIFGIYVIKKLVYYLTISRCIMKIIPISVILNTQELETWIENKY